MQFVWAGLVARRENDEGDLAALAAHGVVLVAVVGLDRQRPEALALLRRGDPGVDLALLGADLHGRLGVGLEVVEPGRVLGEAALGGDDHEVVAVPDVEQRGSAFGPALGADVVEQQHPPGDAGDLVPEPATADAIERRVQAHEATGDRPDPVRDIEVAGRTPVTCRLGAQVYIPPNMPPVTLSTWPCT